MPTLLKRLWNIVTTVLVAAVVLLAVLLVGVRLVGLTPFVVLSGSMEPTYPTGALIYVKKVPAEQIQVGDPITFVMNEDLVVATHRVVDIDGENQRFTTKGDANDAVDGAPVHFKNLIGKPVFCIPKLGYVQFSHPSARHVCGLERHRRAAGASVHARAAQMGGKVRPEGGGEKARRPA